MAGGMAEDDAPHLQGQPPLPEHAHPGFKTEGFRERPGACRDTAGIAPPCRRPDRWAGMVRGLQIWMPIKAVTGETPRRAARVRTATVWKGMVGVMPMKTPRAIPQASFRGSSWRRQEFQPVVAEGALQRHSKVKGTTAAGPLPPSEQPGAAPCPPSSWATRTGTR